MIRCNDEFSIPLDKWKRMISLRRSKTKLLTKKIFRALYKFPEQAARVCLSNSGNLLTPNKKNKRVVISSMNMETITSKNIFMHYWRKKKNFSTSIFVIFLSRLHDTLLQKTTQDNGSSYRWENFQIKGCLTEDMSKANKQVKRQLKNKAP